MAKFLFKLATVLKQRQIIEDQRQRDLAQVLRFKMILLDQLKQMQQTITQSKRELGDALLGQVNLDRVGQFARYSGQTAVRAREIVQRLAVLEKQIEAARQQLLQATAARKAMDLLRERYHQQWREDLERRENNEIDDLSAGAYTRRLALGMER